MNVLGFLSGERGAGRGRKEGVSLLHLGQIESRDLHGTPRA